MGCGNKVKETCGENIYATCVDYEGTLGDNTKITESCITIEETTEDLYEITDEIIEGLDTSDLGNLCLTYPLTGGVVLVKSVLEVHEAKICELEQSITDLSDLENVDITGWTGLDVSCLEGVCATPPQTLGELLQNLSTTVCECDCDGGGGGTVTPVPLSIDVQSSTPISQVTLNIIQEGETMQSIALPANDAAGNTVVTIDQNKTVTFILTDGIAPSGTMIQTSGLTFPAINQLISLSPDVVSFLDVGDNTNVALFVNDVS